MTTTDTATEQAEQHWYVALDHLPDRLHYTDLTGGTDLRPLCSNNWTPRERTRWAQPGDQLCPQCVSELTELAVDLFLPMPECLACQRLHPADEHGALTEHASGTAARCPGSGIRPASRDGRDDVRREALRHRTGLRDYLDQARDDFAEDLRTCRTIADAIGYKAMALVEYEAMIDLWDEVVACGDYLTVVSDAITIALKRYGGGSEIGAAVHRARVNGAREWLRGVNAQVQTMLPDRRAREGALALSAVLMHL